VLHLAEAAHVSVDGDVVRRIGEYDGRRLAAHQEPVGLFRPCIPADEPMVPKNPAVSEAGDCWPVRIRLGRIVLGSALIDLVASLIQDHVDFADVEPKGLKVEVDVN
jgi:hypothetical protein